MYSNLDGTETGGITHKNQIVFLIHSEMFDKCGIQNRDGL